MDEQTKTEIYKQARKELGKVTLPEWQYLNDLEDKAALIAKSRGFSRQECNQVAVFASQAYQAGL